MNVLVLNCGSSSVKFAVLDPTTRGRRAVGLAEGLGGEAPGQLRWTLDGDIGSAKLSDGAHEAALAAIVDLLRGAPTLWGSLCAVGHRVVHGGERFADSVLVDEEVVAQIEAVSALAPLHNPLNLRGIRAAQAHLGHLPQVAVFDTAFHQTLPERAYLYALPYGLYERHGVRRYGFHGTSHRFVAQEATRRLGDPRARLITLHLGNGCSAAAIRGGRSLDTTMGLTPLEGLVMGTRSGSVDPGLHAYLAARLDLDVAGVTAIMNRESGLLGLSEGLASDMRSLLAAADEGHAGARRAIEIFCYRAAQKVMALVVPLGGLDALVFTGGIGEHACPVRARIIELLAPLGFNLDAAANAAHGADSEGRIVVGERPSALVIPTDEEYVIAADTAALAADSGGAEL